MNIYTLSNPLRMDASGTIRIGHTRVTLSSVIHTYLEGVSPEGIQEGFPTVPLSDIYLTIAYYHLHKEEVMAYLGIKAIDTTPYYS